MIRRMLLTLAGTALLIYAGVLAALWWGQEKLLFAPDPLPASHAFSLGTDVHEVMLARPDGVQLHALHLRLPAPRGIVFFLHGNAGNLASWFDDVEFYRQAGYDLFMPDYRGYGKSGGRITSEAQLREDMRAAWQQVSALYPANAVRVIAGRSLGTGLAAGLAAETPPDLTVLVSPYRSMRAVAALHYPWVPGALLRYPLDTEALAPRLTGPTLLLHGDRDALIPPDHSEALLAVLPQAQLHRIAGAGHNDLQQFQVCEQALRAALDAAALARAHAP